MECNKRGKNMLALTKKQLLLVLETHYDRDDKLIMIDDIEKMYKAYGDEYFHDYGCDSPWELTNENEAWKNMRGHDGIPKKNGKKN
jgi:hypothetical protein